MQRNKINGEVAQQYAAAIHATLSVNENNESNER